MSAKAIKDAKNPNISDINKQILEIKRKIQLSEGQRKALFEMRESETKDNSEKMSELRDEVVRLAEELSEGKSTSAKYRVKSSRLETTLGGRLAADKSSTDVEELVDLRILAKTKRLDLIHYKIRKKQSYLEKLAHDYHLLLVEEEKKAVYREIELPVKRTSTDLQNAIHAVSVRRLEAAHVKHRYDDIKETLQKDGAFFEHNIECVEKQLDDQSTEICRLQKICEDAAQMRQDVRADLRREEKSSLRASKQRDKDEREGRRLVTKGKQYLARLERRIFRGGKVYVRMDEDTADVANERTDNDMEEYEEDDSETATGDDAAAAADIFEKLKRATGSVCYEEIVERFEAQKETSLKLASLRSASEAHKTKLEKTSLRLTVEVEAYKYEEAKDAEQNVAVLSKLRAEIQEQVDLQKSFEHDTEKALEVSKLLRTSLEKIYSTVSSRSPTDISSGELMNRIETEFKNKIDIGEKAVTLPIDIDQDTWLPSPYNGLTRITPVPSEETSPVPHESEESEDEEEVPTRSYLKRQAQLAIDARLRRKNIRPQRK